MYFPFTRLQLRPLINLLSHMYTMRIIIDITNTNITVGQLKNLLLSLTDNPRDLSFRAKSQNFLSQFPIDDHLIALSNDLTIFQYPA